MDPAQIEANINLAKALRRASLLAAAAQVSQNITQIMNIDELLARAVDIICDCYGFYYSGVFLIDEAGEFAVLRAGRGEPGRIMIENNHKLAVGGNSMIGACTAFNQARISLDVDTEKVWYPNPVLPETRSEMALPLAIGQRVIGAVTVQSTEGAAFSDEDVSSLQAMANQLAIALDNARQRRELEETHAELVRAKTFEAIATATGDAIHWVGNKAEPIPGSVDRIRSDVQTLVCAVTGLLQKAVVGGKPAAQHPLVQLLSREVAIVQENEPDIAETAQKMLSLPLTKLEQRLSLFSTLEDLQIIDTAATLITKVKEELIGPAREQAPRPTMLEDVVKDAITGLQLLPGVVSVEQKGSLPLVVADPVQLNRVFVNLLKNAVEATGHQPDPRIQVMIRADDKGEFVLVDVADNGTGIPEADLDNIWITFHTTKGIRGHAGLGLPACRLILQHLGGQISVTSQPGQGSTFTVSVPVYKGKETEARGESGKGKIVLIDDNDSWRQFAGAALENGGYRVAASGQRYSTDNYQQYDLIVVDDILAEGDSSEIVRAIKAAGAIYKTLIVSSNPRVERTKDLKLLGVYDVLPKPYIRAKLLGEVKNALNSVR